MARVIFSIFILFTSYHLCYGQQKVIIYYDTVDQVKESYTILNNDSSLIDGNYEMFYTTGEPALTGSYDHGQKSGIFTEFYRSGGKKREINFSNRSGKERLLTSQSLGYMLISVKPGIVLISLR